MSRKHASSWEIEDLDPRWDAGAPPRAKPLARRVAATWEEQEGGFVATIGPWAVRVVRGREAATWEWSAFRGTRPRALRCVGFRDAEAARRDAEMVIERQE
jgi:hypothetical protein